MSDERERLADRLDRHADREHPAAMGTINDLRRAAALLREPQGEAPIDAILDLFGLQPPREWEPYDEWNEPQGYGDLVADPDTSNFGDVKRWAMAYAKWLLYWEIVDLVGARPASPVEPEKPTRRTIKPSAVPGTISEEDAEQAARSVVMGGIEMLNRRIVMLEKNWHKTVLAINDLQIEIAELKHTPKV